MASAVQAVTAWDHNATSYFEDVVDWHLIAGSPVRSHVDDHGVDAQLDLGWALIEEEFKELKDAVFNGEGEKTADGIADLVWVLCGYAARNGINLDAVWGEVRRANYDKYPYLLDAKGKITKPENWRAPDITAALKVKIS
jgi:NTP pyrophosphatase (non-canonical NTP hydrolase)